MTAFREDLAAKLFVRDAPDCAEFALGSPRAHRDDRRCTWDERIALVATECVRAAGALARAACEAWGHDFHAFVPSEIGAATVAVAELGRFPSHEACARCGEKRTK